MFIITISRNGNIHIVNYQLHNSDFRTMCGKTVSKNDHILTLAADNTNDLMCKECKRDYDEMYLSDLNYHLSMARSAKNVMYDKLLKLNRNESLGPKKYILSMIRYWEPLISYQRLVKRNKKYGK